jgi:hypothetical protein
LIRRSFEVWCKDVEQRLEVISGDFDYNEPEIGLHSVYTRDLRALHASGLLPEVAAKTIVVLVRRLRKERMEANICAKEAILAKTEINPEGSTSGGEQRVSDNSPGRDAPPVGSQLDLEGF